MYGCWWCIWVPLFDVVRECEYLSMFLVYAINVILYFCDDGVCISFTIQHVYSQFIVCGYDRRCVIISWCYSSFECSACFCCFFFLLQLWSLHANVHSRVHTQCKEFFILRYSCHSLSLRIEFRLETGRRGIHWMRCPPKLFMIKH